MEPRRNLLINPFAPGNFAEKRLKKLVESIPGDCVAMKNSNPKTILCYTCKLNDPRTVV